MRCVLDLAIGRPWKWRKLRLVWLESLSQSHFCLFFFFWELLSYSHAPLWRHPDSFGWNVMRRRHCKLLIFFLNFQKESKEKEPNFRHQEKVKKTKTPNKLAFGLKRSKNRPDKKESHIRRRFKQESEMKVYGRLFVCKNNKTWLIKYLYKLAQCRRCRNIRLNNLLIGKSSRVTEYSLGVPFYSLFF